jgi:hypothetical protein
LKRLRLDSQKELSELCEKFFLKAELVYRHFSAEQSVLRRKEGFKKSVQSQLMSDFHCKAAEMIIEPFFKLREKKAKCREIHSSNKYASKSLSR